MTIRLRDFVLGTLAGTVVLVVWGMVFWAWLADPLGVFRVLPNSEAITQLLVENETATGVYFMPWPRNTSESFARFVEQHRRGPFYLLSYVREGVDPQSPGKILLGTLHYATVALVAVLILALARNNRYPHRFAIVVLAGLLGTNFITLADPIWFHLPWGHTLGNVLYELAAWVLLAAVVAALVRPVQR